MGIDIVRAIQRISNPALDLVMESVTLFGEPIILAAVFCAIYWCADKRLGKFLAIALGASVCVNGAIKDIFKVERIFNKDGISSLRVATATGYSFPSGHTQTATTFWGGLALVQKRNDSRILFGLLILLVGFSRLYLGVHYPTDVLGGLVIGASVTSLVFYTVIVKENRWLVLLLCIAAIAAALLVGESEDTFAAAGLFIGILSGLWFEDELVRFSSDNLRLTTRLARFALGMALVGIAYTVPKMILPRTMLLDSMRYALTAFTMTGAVPYVFKKAGL